jgi:hypothetical protein
MVVGGNVFTGQLLYEVGLDLPRISELRYTVVWSSQVSFIL